MAYGCQIPSAQHRSDQDEGQSDWSLEQCQELLGQVTAEETRFHGSVEESDEPKEEMHESLSKFPPDNCANEPTAVESCSRVTPSIVVAAKDEPARQELNSSGESGSKQPKPNSTKVKKKVKKKQWLPMMNLPA